MSTLAVNAISPASGGTVTITGAALTTPALGTPASGTLTNCTGLPASGVVNTPAGGISATNVQAALNELDTEKLNKGEEGTWTPVDQSGADLTFSAAFGYYTKVGDLATAFGRVTFPTTVSALTIVIGGLPFVVANNDQPGGGFIRLTNSGRSDTVVASAATSHISFYANTLVAAVNSDYSGDRVDFVVIYKV